MTARPRPLLTLSHTALIVALSALWAVPASAALYAFHDGRVWGNVQLTSYLDGALNGYGAAGWMESESSCVWDVDLPNAQTTFQSLSTTLPAPATNTATVTDEGESGGDFQLEYTITVTSFTFATNTPHGPYALDPGTLNFEMDDWLAPTAEGEFNCAGHVDVDGQSYPFAYSVPANRMRASGVGFFDDDDYPESLILDFNSSGFLLWSHQQADPLVDITVAGRSVQLHVTRLMASTDPTGTLAWTGTPIPEPAAALLLASATLLAARQRKRNPA